MLDRKEASVSSPSLVGEESLQDGIPREAIYHETDVFGHEEDHDVRPLPYGFELL